MKWLIPGLIAVSAPLAWADDADPYFRAINCKSVWSELSPMQKAKVPGTDAAIAEIDKVLGGYVASGAKTARAIAADISDFKAYSKVELYQLKDWRDCVAYYAPAAL